MGEPGISAVGWPCSGPGIDAEGQPYGLTLYEFAADGALIHWWRGARAEVLDDGRWRWYRVHHKALERGQWRDARLATWEWPGFLTPQQLRQAQRLQEVDVLPQSLAPSLLWGYIQQLKEQSKPTHRYELALWQKLALPLTVLLMVAMALPFALGAPRAGMSQRLLLGALLGIGYYLLNQIAANLSLLLTLSVPLATFSPLLILALPLSFWYWQRRS